MRKCECCHKRSDQMYRVEVGRMHVAFTVCGDCYENEIPQSYKLSAEDAENMAAEAADKAERRQS